MAALGTGSVGRVAFRLLGDAEIAQSAFAAIDSYELFTPQELPVEGGVYDARLGTTDYKYACVTCGRDKETCPGHRGVIELRARVLQPTAVAEVVRWLRVVCFACGALIPPPEKYARVAPGRRLAALAAAAADGGGPCPLCRAPHPGVRLAPDDHFTIQVDVLRPAGARRPPAAGPRKGAPPPAEGPPAEGAPAAAGAGGGPPPREVLHPDAIAEILERVPEGAVRAMGRAQHPRVLVLQRVGVPPVTIRPGIRSFGGGGSSHHDSTTLLQSLVRKNGQLPERAGEALARAGAPGAAPLPYTVLNGYRNLQQIYHDLVMGSGSTSATQGSGGKRGILVGGRPPSSFMRLLARKEGQIRASLLGKRTFFAGRSTISGNSALAIDEVGVPLNFARLLQVEEHVQEFNRDWLMTFFLNGRQQYPGSTYVLRQATGEWHDVGRLRGARLEVGDVLRRDTVTGDVVLFNRPPTLERSSTSALSAVVIQDPGVHTLQINVTTCAWFNADFDGDAMWICVVRGAGPRVEAALLSAARNWLVSTKNGTPALGQVQDAVLGLFRLTQSGVALDRYHAMALFAAALNPPRFDRGLFPERAGAAQAALAAADPAAGARAAAAGPAGARVAGRDVASLLLAGAPVNFRRAPASFDPVLAPFIAFDPEETLTVVEQGRMLRGVLDAASVGAKEGGVYHRVAREFGSQRALDAMFEGQQVALQFLLREGFTVGTADLVPAFPAEIAALVAAVRLEAAVVSQQLLRGEIVPPIGATVRGFYEARMREALRVNDGELMRWVLKGVAPRTNGLLNMVAPKVKGSLPNLAHIMGVIGQTTVNGGRIREALAFRRTLPYFPRFSLDPAAYGFVASSYISGMTSPEFICQGTNGRVDLITKALATAGGGYFMRKGVMNNQSALVDNWRRVTKEAALVQRLYGDDGFDPRALERAPFRTFPLGDAALAEALGVAAEPDVAAAVAADPGAAAAVAAALARARADRDALRARSLRVELANAPTGFDGDQAEVHPGKGLPELLLTPVDVQRLVEGVFVAAGLPLPGRGGAPSAGAGGAPPPFPGGARGLAARLARAEALAEGLPYGYLNEGCARRGAPVPPHLRAGASTAAALVRAELSPRVLARLTEAQLAFVEDSVRLRFDQALIDYGTAVGILAAQAVSEPITQYTLDSHHRSVAGGTTKAGITRVGEIYGARPLADEAAPGMILYLRQGAGGPAAEVVATAAEFVTLRHFVRTHDILLEPAEALVYPPTAGDAAWLAEFGRAHPLVRTPGDLTNWCLRFVLNKEALVLKAVELELIVGRLRARNPALHVVHTPEASPEIVVRAWLRAGAFKKGARAGGEAPRVQEVLEEALGAPVRGVPGVGGARAVRVAARAPGPGGDMGPAPLAAVVTQGSNLYGACLLRGVDPTRVVSSSVDDTYRLLGVEAAQAKIVAETRAFMTSSAPNLRHLLLYACEMTRTGRVTSLERGGLKAREGANVLLGMAFQNPVGEVVGAAVAGALAPVYGIAAPQLLGGTPLIGSLFNRSVVNEAFVRANTASVDRALGDLV
jgi:DNA-directed RNA polymerase beta' subunit